HARLPSGPGPGFNLPEGPSMGERIKKNAAELASGYGFEFGAVFRRLVARREIRARGRVGALRGGWRPTSRPARLGSRSPHPHRRQRRMADFKIWMNGKLVPQ